jgi:tetratricopeptide (TPR) repeat protein
MTTAELTSQVERFISKRWGPPLVITLAVLVVWAQSLTFSFVWDDYLFIVRNHSLRSWRHIPEMLWSAKPSAAPNRDPVPMFRPVRTVHFALLRSLGGRPEPQPWVFHLANLFWHTVTALLFYSVAWRLFARFREGDIALARMVALFVSLAFAIHPAVSEVVCWAKSLDDLLAAAFMLAALRALLKRTDAMRGYLAALAWFAVAIYAKESVVPFALLVLFVARLYHRQSWAESFRTSSGFLVLAAVYVVHRGLVIGRMAQGAPLSGSYSQTLVDMLPVVTRYLRLLCGVPPFYADYSFLEARHPFFSGSVLLGLVLLVTAIGAVAWFWRTQPLAALGLIWLGLFLLPVSNLLPMMQYMAERFLYVPLMGFLLMLGWLIARIPRANLAALSGVALLAVWTGASLQRAPVWKDELTLFTHTWLDGARSARVEKNMLLAVFRLPHVQKLFPIDPETEVLRMEYNASAEDAQAVAGSLEQARLVLPNNVMVASALGLTYAKLARAQPALEMLEAAVKLEPSVPRQWLNLAVVAMAFKETNKARLAFEQVLRLDPTNQEALRYDGDLNRSSGKDQKPR